MDTYQDTRRQIRIAIALMMIILPVGIIGFMLIEKMSLLDAVWVTVVTLATIGYGDLVARTDIGRIFTIVLIFVGLGVFAFAAQATLSFLFSPEIINIRQRRLNERRIAKLQHHYIICGEGELVDKTVDYLMRRSEIHRTQEAALNQARGRIRHLIKRFYKTNNGDSLLDVVVVVTQNAGYARLVHDQGLLVVEGDSSDDHVLRRAGVRNARALMAMSSSDTETLLTVLTARSRNPELLITAATLDDTFAQKMLRAGANHVLAPFDVAGQFLNNATFRPAVNDFFNSILFEQRVSGQVIQLFLYDDSPWIAQTLDKLQLREKFAAAVIGIRGEDGDYIYTPPESYLLKEEEILLVVVPSSQITAIQKACREGTLIKPHPANWQRLPGSHMTSSANKHYSLIEAEAAAAEISQHFIICSGSMVARNAIDKLNPERPFVIISEDNQQTAELLRRGFRVVHGSPTQENVLKKAGITRALAIMISMDDRATSVLTTLTSRSMSKTLLITATADNDEMIVKLRRAGADRVINPFRIAAQFVLLSTTRPAVSDFLQHVLFNPQVGLETTELYMQDDSPWIGKKIEELYLRRIFNAGVIGIRLANGRYVYAPPESHIIGRNEVLIVTVPMSKSDDLREIAHGSITKRPKTLRHDDVLKTGLWNF